VVTAVPTPLVALDPALEYTLEIREYVAGAIKEYAGNRKIAGF
jgi:hypothetical protein